MKKLLFIAAMALLAGCQKEDIQLFTSDDAGIYFQQTASFTLGTTNVTYRDSTQYSFATSAASVKQQKINVPVLILGNVKDYDRTFKVAIDEQKTTATRGVHFDVNLDSLCIYAGKNSFNIPVILYRRHPDVLNNTYRIELVLQENDHFKLLIPEYKNNNQWNSTGTMLDGCRWKIIFDEKYKAPSYWTSFGESYFGKWTVNRYLLLNEVMDWTVSDWNNAGMAGTKIGAGRFAFAARALQKELQTRVDNGKPEKDNDGKYMQLPSPYEVDYSNYETNN